MEVLYEDNHIIVVVKPQNIPSQSDKSGDIDLLTMVKEYVKIKYNKKGEAYIGLVHRLDRPVGGIMVFARTSKAASRLSEKIRNKEFKKTYLAMVDGKFDEKDGVLEDYLYKDERNNISKVVSKEKKNSKLAKLNYKVIDYDERSDLSLVKINLETGRHHQIRVQMANCGHSLYGDQKYGVRGKRKKIRLWAYKVEFMHPVKNENMVFINFPEWVDEGILEKDLQD